MLGPQFSQFEQNRLRERSVWQNGNEHHVAAIVDKHATDAPTLYRGISVNAERNYFDPHTAKVGDSVHLPVSSFSSDRDTGVEFAHAAQHEEGAGDYTPVMLQVHGARGVDVSSTSNLPWEKEWLSKGQFEITHRTSDPDNDIDHVFHLKPREGR